MYKYAVWSIVYSIDRITLMMMKTKASMGIERDHLSQLPVEIQLLIFQNLDYMEFLRFNAVCKAWRSVASAARQTPLFRLQQVPWLIHGVLSDQLPKLSHQKMVYRLELCGSNDGRNGSNETNGSKRKPFFFLGNRNPGLVPHTFLKIDSSRICGSSEGWLLLSQSTTAFNNGDNFLLNPLTGQRISLPGNPNSIMEMGVILPQSVVKGDGLISVVAYFRDDCFHQWRSQDEHWTKIAGHGGSFTISDMIYHKGNIFAINNMKRVYKIDISSEKPDCCLRARSPFVGYRPRFIHLVECNGDLLTVVRTFEEELETDEVRVFKYNPIMDWWEKVESIGEKYGLLVGKGNSMAIDVSTNGNFRANCVYFLEDDDYLGQGIQCFDLAKIRFGIFVPYSWDAEATPPTWFIPKDPED